MFKEPNKILNRYTTRWPSLAWLSAGILLVYNPLTKFPYTFLVIIVYILVSTYIQNGSLQKLNFKKIGLHEVKIILIVYAALELSMDFIFQPMVNKAFNEPADYSAFYRLKGNTALYLKWLIYMWISAALGEELLFRSFVFSQLKGIFKNNMILIVLVSALLFCLPHIYQGTSGLVITFIMGLAFGILYMRMQHIWINVIVHGLIDSVFLTVCYLGYWDLYSFSW